MKKLFLLIVVALFGFNANAQDDDSSSSQTSKGKWLIEANTGSAMLGSTSINFASSDGHSSYNIGLDGGYFVMDDLAIKAGLGFGGFSPDEGDNANSFSYRLGAKYYVSGIIPVTVDLTGASGEAVETFTGEKPMWLGLGAGYALFIAESVSIEPGLRYNLSLNEDYTDQGIFQFNVGFALHF